MNETTLHFLHQNVEHFDMENFWNGICSNSDDNSEETKQAIELFSKEFVDVFGLENTEESIVSCENPTNVDDFHSTKGSDSFEISNFSTNFMVEPKILENDLSMSSGEIKTPYIDMEALLPLKKCGDNSSDDEIVLKLSEDSDDEKEEISKTNTQTVSIVPEERVKGKEKNLQIPEMEIENNLDFEKGSKSDNFSHTNVPECIMSTSIFFKPSHIKDELTNTDCDDERDDSILVCDQETSSLEEVQRNWCFICKICKSVYEPRTQTVCPKCGYTLFYKCEECLRYFLTCTACLRHIEKKKCHPPNIYACNDCNYVTRHKRFLERHILMHRKKLENFSNFRKQKKNKTRRKDSKCNYCSFRNAFQWNLRRHILHHHEANLKIEGFL